ncbi:MAG: tetratricopeptide repeat protein, partial [Tannerella sp.]|nr:tetratricopeptide repeat protein [Tannerella sp.]
MKELLNRYLKMEDSGIITYFDADEIVDLLDHFEEEDDLLHYKKALELGRKLHPDDRDIKIRTCRLHIYDKEYKKALKLIDLIDNGIGPEVELMRMACYCAMDRFDEVLAFIKKLEQEVDECEVVRDMDSFDYLEETFEYLAPILNELEKYKEAYDLIKRGLAFYPDNLILKEELCYIYEERGEVQQALEICKELIDKDPYSVDYWYMQGRLYAMAEDYEKAIKSYDFALACDNSDLEVKIQKAYCLFMNENYEKAIEIYVDLLPEGDDIYEQIQPILADCYLKSDRFEEAYDLFKDLMKKTYVSPQLPVYKDYIHCCLKTDRDVEALSALLVSSYFLPDDLLSLSLRTLFHIIKDEQGEATHFVEQILSTLYLIGLNEEDALNTTIQILNVLYNIGKIEPDAQITEAAPSYWFVGRDVMQMLREVHQALGEKISEHLLPVHQAIGYLINGDNAQFCRY